MSDLLDLDQPLPRHDLHMIEASAGTGKTYTLATLVLRYVVEHDVKISEVLLVTFTNEAAAELRHRVRERLQMLLRGVEAVATANPDGDPGDPDPLLTQLCDRMDHAAIATRLRSAVNDFDQATITTIHSFSQQILLRAGLENNPNTKLRSDLSTVEADIVIDHVAELSLHAETDAGVVLPDAKKVVNGLQMARNHPGISLMPDAGAAERVALLEQLQRECDTYEIGDITSDQALRMLDLWDRAGSPQTTLISNRTKTHPASKVDDALAEVRRSHAAAGAVHHAIGALRDHLDDRGEVGFSDLLTKAAELLGRSPRLRAELRERFRVMFVDEFQDTDPTQWSMMSHLLGTGAESDQPGQGLVMPGQGLVMPGQGLVMPGQGLVMIVVGDPKQAIYRFRGGDIATYLAAKSMAEARLHSLGTNYRSQAPLIEALNVLFEQVEFGEGIGYAPVDPSDAAVKTKRPRNEPAPVDVRLIAHAKVDDQRRAAAADLADLVVHANQPDPKKPDAGIKFSDIAVLYNSHAHGPEILRALEKRNVPAVITRGESVLESTAVAHWRSLFWALERPTDSSRAKAAGLTPFLGLTPADIRDEKLVRDLQAKLRGLAGQLETRGIAFVSRVVLREWKGAVSLAARPGGDREIVDVEHIAELLHIGTSGGGVSAAAARELLDELVFADPDDVDYAADLTKRRLDTETDEDVVRIMSVHAAKGLEFEMVCCPTLSTTVSASSPVHYADDDGTQILHFTHSKIDRGERKEATGEQLAESARLAYVALTRAKQRLVIWWPGTKRGEEDKPAAAKSGLGEILNQRSQRLAGAPLNAPGTLRKLSELHPTLFSVAEVPLEPKASQAQLPFGNDAMPPSMAISTVQRQLDRSAGRLSFSGITNTAFPYEDRHQSTRHDPEVPDDVGSQDENPDEILDLVEPRMEDEVTLAALPAGKDAGTKMHVIFENVDFALEPTERRTAIEAEVAQLFGEELDDDARTLVIDGLDQAMQQPLGEAVANVTLADITLGDRLDEMQFDLPLRPGVDDAATLPQLSALLLQHLPESDEPTDRVIREWAESLASPKRLVRLSGFLTGSIDLLFRQPASDGAWRYVVADYKSNKIARWPERMTPDMYKTDPMIHEMVHGQYLLQALLYMVATNRFLKQRVEGYDPEIHLGPAAYLFVRGMTGQIAADGQPHGVITWRPPTDLLLDVDALLLRAR